MIKLPFPQLKGKVSLEETILRRRSVRRYRREPLDLSQLSQILWSAQGITGTRGFRVSLAARQSKLPQNYRQAFIIMKQTHIL